jgi:hypothetical protein
VQRYPVVLYGSRRVVLLATAMGALLLAPAISEARPRCKFGQIFRPSLGICQSKMAKAAQPYISTRVRSAPVALKPSSPQGGTATIVEPDNASELLSTIPMLEPKAQGSLNPLPRWKSGL